MTRQIDHSWLEGIGGEDALIGAIAAFSQALVDHAGTVDVPAPTAHPLVEDIVRNHGGQYEIVNVPVPGPDPDPEPEPQDPLERPLELAQIASARLAISGWDVIGLERSPGMSLAFVADVDTVWVFFDEPQSDTEYIVTPADGVTKYPDYIEVSKPGLSAVSLIVQRVL